MWFSLSFPAYAAEATYKFDIPAETLSQALTEFGQTAAQQIIYSEELVKGKTTPGLHGSFTASQAIEALLAGSGLKAERNSAGVVMVSRKGDDTSGSNTPPERPQLAAQESGREEITVTARKREESIVDVPVSITAFTAETIQDYNIQSFSDYATKTPNLSFSYGNGSYGVASARTVAIRGVAGANTTGFYIDDSPLPASIDPRVLDLDNIEVLKGPQGTLFGESSLGGNVRLITKKPDLDKDDFNFMLQGGATAHGGAPDGGGSGVANLVVMPDKLAIRIVGFSNNDAGYTTRTYLSDPANPNSPRESVGNQGDQYSFGGSVTALLRVVDNFDVSLRLMYQNTQDYGYPASYAPLPSFTPLGTMDRTNNIQNEATDHWFLPSLVLEYRGDGWTVDSSTSYFYRHTHDEEDDTEGSIQALQNYLGYTSEPGVGYAWGQTASTEQLTQETRLAFDPIYNLSGTVGVYYSKQHLSGLEIPPVSAPGLASSGILPLLGLANSDLLWTSGGGATQQDTALFGELYYKFLDKFTFTAGARQYWLTQTNDPTIQGAFEFGEQIGPHTSNSEHGISPKFALSYQATDDAMIYASAAKGFRAGGTGPGLPDYCAPGLSPLGLTPHSAGQYQPDTIWDYEVGGKVELPDPKLLLTASAFQIDWNRIQQSIFVPQCGFTFTGNAGAAQINGGELEILGPVFPGFQIRAGAGYDDAKITQQGGTGQPVGARIQQVPKWTISAGGVYTQSITDSVDAFVSVDYAYVGDSVSSNSGAGLNLIRPSYGILNGRFGVDWGRSELSLNLSNLSDQSVNAGDLGYVGYERFVDGKPLPIVATLPPFTAMLQYRFGF